MGEFAQGGGDCTMLPRSVFSPRYRPAPSVALASPCPCILSKADILEHAGKKVLRGAAQPHAKNRIRRPAADRATLGASDAAAQRDRGRPGIVSPNSRQSRIGPSSTCELAFARKGWFHDADSAIAWIGIDVAKDSLDAWWDDAAAPHALSVANAPAGFASLIQELPPAASARIVVEATGGYERALVTALVEAGYRVAVVNPRQVRDFAKALGILAKTDRIDACVLARFGEQVQPRLLEEDPARAGRVDAARGPPPATGRVAHDGVQSS